MWHQQAEEKTHEEHEIKVWGTKKSIFMLIRKFFIKDTFIFSPIISMIRVNRKVVGKVVFYGRCFRYFRNYFGGFLIIFIQFMHVCLSHQK